MSLLQRSAIVTAMLAALAVPAYAQSASAEPAAASAPAGGKRHGPSAEQREAHWEKRLQALKSALKLNANQEAAWATYTAAIKPQRPAPGDRPDRAAFASMTTPERIDAMQALHSKRQAEMQARMEQHNQATKTFYAALTAEQQKTFDAETLKMHQGPRGAHHDGQPPRHEKRQGSKSE